MDPDPDPDPGSIIQKRGSEDPDPDPPQNVMDPEHCNKGNLFRSVSVEMLRI